VIVVSDTSPIHYLVLIGKADLLHRLFGRVLVPQVVAKELTNARAPREVREWMQSPPEWVEARNPRAVDPTLEASRLGLGEIHAISLAVEVRANILLADDKDARAAAAKRGLTVTGTLGVLKLAAKRKLIVLSSTISDLRKTNIRMPDSTIQELLREDASPPPTDS
jgi:predicted nucleic acid-binding protein